jgi:hypothetical protein
MALHEQFVYQVMGITYIIYGITREAKIIGFACIYANLCQFL